MNQQYLTQKEKIFKNVRFEADFEFVDKIAKRWKTSKKDISSFSSLIL
jgi:hypothetical protein